MTQSSAPSPILTADGSHSLYSAVFGQTYHSAQGALQESRHVFISLGLQPFIARKQPIRLLEMGFGTGLNALLTWQQAEQHRVAVDYVGVEAYPVSEPLYRLLNFDQLVGFVGTQALHKAAWGQEVVLSATFRLSKEALFFADFLANHPPQPTYDLVYYDAFSPTAQPELWTEEVFTSLFHLLNVGGSLVTYSSKGSVRRALKASGFEVEKHPGPGHKREVVRAFKAYS